MKPVQAGKLKDRISCDEYVSSQSSSGATKPTWTTRAVVWGSVEPLRGSEALRTGVSLADLDTRIFLRVGPKIETLNPKWRLRSGTVIYDIFSVIDVENAGRMFEVLCKSGLNKG